MNGSAVAATIRERRLELAERAVALQYEQQPLLQERYGDEGREKSVRDAAYHLDYVAEALDADDVAIFADYVRWLKALLAQLGIEDEIIEASLDLTERVLEEALGSDTAAPAVGIIREARLRVGSGAAEPESHLEPLGEMGALAHSYLDALLAGDRHTASRLILEAVEAGMSIRDIYIDVFQGAQREIGRLWQLNRVSVAQEHFATAATQMIMSQLYPRIFRSERVGRRFVGTCVGGELHEIGIRMVADFFEMEGWDTYYLGANAPPETIVETVEKQRPDVLGISATMTFHVGEVTELIERVRASAVADRTRILVGGYPFNVSPGLWKKIGADGYAPGAMETIATAEQLLA